MSIYIGVNGKARKVIGGYIGINGKAEIIYSGSDVPNTYIPYSFIYRKAENYAELAEEILTNTFTQIICDFKLSTTVGYYQSGNNVSPRYEGIFDCAGGSAYIKFDTDSKAYCVISKGSNTYTSSALTAGTIYTINMTKNTSGDCYFGNSKIFTNIETITQGSNIYVLSRAYKYGSNAFNVQAFSKVYIKGLTGYNLTTQKYLFDYRPCIKIDNTYAGMYNKITNNFIFNGDHYTCTN